jgi:DHA1 family bicyclomycin/chloramphenicol resistance-like MFS transporter
MLASILAANAPTIDLLITARALQGIGAAAGPLVARAIIRDVYGHQGAGRMMGLVMASFGICAIIAPIFGGQLVDWLDWRAPFWIAAAYALALLFLVWRALPETLPKEGGEPLNLRELTNRFRLLLTDVRFILVAFCGSSVNCAMFAWISGSGIVVQTVYGFSPTMHGAIFAASVLGFVLMSFLSARLAPKYGSARLIRVGLIITATGGVIGLVTGLLVPADALWPLFGVFLVMIGHGFTLPQSLALAIQPFPLIAASASALFGFLQYIGGAIVSTLNGALFDNTAVPMLALMAVTTLAPALAWFLFSGPLLRSEEKSGNS